jgi:hypothetical protein
MCAFNLQVQFLSAKETLLSTLLDEYKLYNAIMQELF